ncbi:MAG TPA: hypothetical protein VFQ76_19620 [Longimicrobiaceae bacterium]|nr:hypothetical protein [Longimicrobiaceae bacterium]
MAKIKDAVVRVGSTGQVLRADCVGNNAAVECPGCLGYPVLLIARPDQHGSSAKNPGRCRHCGCRVYITDDVSPGRHLTVVTVAVLAGYE